MSETKLCVNKISLGPAVYKSNRTDIPLKTKIKIEL